MIKEVERKHNIKEKIYLIEVIRGLLVTSSHFFNNIIIHICQLFGFLKDKQGAITIQYPEEKREISPRWRARHRLMKRDDGSPRCTACMCCATICPAKCINIIAGEREDEFEKYPLIFEINALRCVYCGLCVEACPLDAIRMDTFDLNTSDYNRENFIYNKDFLLGS